MKLTWLGHACFLLEEDGFIAAVDPYAGVEGYPELRTAAHAVYCSHDHFDHNAREAVRLLPERPSPFAVKEISAFHDEQRGALRGTDTIRVFTAGGVSAVHLGDLGHQLSREQIGAIGKTDVLLIPVGGFYTIGAARAKAVCEALNPRCVVPMHYRHAPFGLPQVGPVEDFLALWPQERIHRLDGPALDITPDLNGVYVPKFA